MTGVITRVITNKGFAFVRGGDRISRFAHASQFKPTEAFDLCREGQTVEFTPVTVAQGHRAYEVTIVPE